MSAPDYDPLVEALSKRDSDPDWIAKLRQALGSVSQYALYVEAWPTTKTYFSGHDPETGEVLGADGPVYTDEEERAAQPPMIFPRNRLLSLGRDSLSLIAEPIDSTIDLENPPEGHVWMYDIKFTNIVNARLADTETAEPAPLES